MSAIEVRHFSCHNTDLGNKRDVTAHTAGSKVTYNGKGQNSAVSRCGLIRKILVA